MWGIRLCGVFYIRNVVAVLRKQFEYLPNSREVKFLEQVNPLTGIAWEISLSFSFQLDATSWWSRINKFLLGERGDELYISESWISSELGVA